MSTIKIAILGCVIGVCHISLAVDYDYDVGPSGQTMAVSAIPADATRITKRGSGILTLTGDSGSFAGTFIVAEGTVKARANAFSSGSAVEVQSGATWDMIGGGSTWSAPSPMVFTIAGAGDTGNGYDSAFVRTSGTAIRSNGSSLILSDDATVSTVINHNFGSVSLAGHKLTKKGGGTWDAYGNVTFTTGGDTGAIEITAGAIQLQDGKPFSTGNEKNVLTLHAGTSFLQYPVSWNGSVIPWKLNVAGNATLKTMGSGTTPVNQNLPIWKGPVDLTGGNLTVATERGVTQFRIDGTITSTAGYGIVGKALGAAEICGSVEIDGAIVNAPRADKVSTKMVFEGNVAQSGTSANFNDGGLLRFEGSDSVDIAGAFGASSDKYDQNTTGRTEVVNVKYFKHRAATYLSGTLENPQTLVVRNSTWDGAGTDMAVGNNASKGCVYLYDSVFTNNVRLGNSQWEQYGYGMGAIYQHRGETTVGAFSYHQFSLGRCGLTTRASSYGYYLNDGGIFTENAGGAAIGWQGLGVFEMTGGSATGAGSWDLGAGPGTGIYRQTGGTNEVYRMVLGSRDGTGCGRVVLEGSQTCLRMKSGGGAFTMAANNANGSPFEVVVNDGATLWLNAAGMSRNADVIEGVTTKWYCCVDGGVLMPGWSGYFTGRGARTPDRTIVGAKGIVIDTSNNGNDGTRDTASRYGQAFEAPVGKVVTAIALPTDDAFVGATGAQYMGPVDVVITGTGVGASAVAVFDESTRRITGIRVVSGGTGYDENTTATLRSADVLSLYDCQVTVADAPTAGEGFVKRGAHAFCLENANTYKGPTSVEGGVLYVETADAVPTGSALSVANGATLDLHGNSVTTPSLTCGGTIQNGEVTTSELVLTTASRMTVASDATVRLATGAAVSFTGDLASLDKEQQYALISGRIVCDGAVSLPTLPDRWKLSLSGKGLTLKQERGMCVVIR